MEKQDSLRIQFSSAVKCNYELHFFRIAGAVNISGASSEVKNWECMVTLLMDDVFNRL